MALGLSEEKAVLPAPWKCGIWRESLDRTGESGKVAAQFSSGGLTAFGQSDLRQSRLANVAVAALRDALLNAIAGQSRSSCLPDGRNAAGPSNLAAASAPLS